MNSISRRSFVGTSVLAALGLSACGPKIIKPARPTLDLSLVLAEYVRLHNYLEAQKAEAVGKNFIIVSGAAHISSNSSVLGESMLGNICYGSGIRNYIPELKEEKVAEVREAARQASKLAQQDRKYIDAYDIGLLQAVKEGVLSAIQFPPQFDLKYSPKIGSFQIILNYLLPRGFAFHEGDPLHDLDDGGKNQMETYPKREAAMREAIEKVTGSRLCNLGGAHMPRIVELLRANKDNHVVPINLTGDLEIYEHAEINKLKTGDAKADVDIENAYQMLHGENARKLAECYTVNIPLDPQLSPSQCLAMMMLAANEQRLASNEIDILTREQQKDAITTVEFNIPQRAVGK